MSTSRWVVISEHKAACSVDNFYSGIKVWLERPNVVNKRLLGAVTVIQEQEICPTAQATGSNDEERGRHVLSALSRLHFEEERLIAGSEACGDESRGRGEVPDGSGVGLMVKASLRQLLPKMRGAPKGWEAVLVDNYSHTVVFCPLSNLEPPCSIPECSYMLQFSPAASQEGSVSSSKICLLIRRPLASPSPSADRLPTMTSPTCSTNGVTAPSHEWLGSALLPKVAQWSVESAKQLPASGELLGRRRKRESLIPLGRYSQLYAELKEKYGPTLVQNWPEGTDPHKFVYEDIAIATYLLVLWEEERIRLRLKQKQSFIDLGCGNGLLVYLLTSEGHPGKGIDLRERKIWRMYGGKAQLEVCSLEPSENTTFPNYDWLLGNHSDELTPWIPVMAARSSFTTRYFVLPCCAHDFNKKFTRRTAGKSQYQSYLDYVCEIGETMGFVVKEDTLRIPSSKRVCQVGMGRTYTHSQEGVVDEKRREFLFERCGSRSSVDCTHRDLAQDDSGDCECDMIPTSLLMNQSGDLDGTCDEQAKTGNPKYVRSVVATCKAQLHHLSTTLDNPSPDKLTPPRPVTDLSLRQGEHEESPREKPSSPWITGFRPRDPKEVVRNCSHVNLEVKKVIVDTLTRHLLQTENYIIVGQFQSGRVSSEVGQQPLSSAVSLISTMQQKQPHKQLQQQLGEDPTSVNESGKSLRSAETSHKNIDDDDDGNVSGDGELKSRRVCGCLRDQRESVATAVNVVGRSGGCNDGDRSCLSAGDCLHREALLTENTITCISKEHTHCETVKWNLGGKIHLSEAAAMFDNEVLSQLKREYGGLQTLLRNEHQIFKVSGGYIQLRDWSRYTEQGPRKRAKPLSNNQKQAKELLFKTKLCWFHLSHPQGCPRLSQDCPYSHGEGELRKRPNFKDVLDCSDKLLSLT